MKVLKRHPEELIIELVGCLPYLRLTVGFGTESRTGEGYDHESRERNAASDSPREPVHDFHCSGILVDRPISSWLSDEMPRLYDRQDAQTCGLLPVTSVLVVRISCFSEIAHSCLCKEKV
jgi:hypothetical protein